jgi:hypothetical protein
MTDTHGTGHRVSEPAIFYDIRDERRWHDKFKGTSRVQGILTPDEWREKNNRDRAYRIWLQTCGLRPKHMQWQRVRVTGDTYEESNKQDWWPRYYGAIFTVFLEPETLKEGDKWIQYYVLSPRDGELVMLHEMKRLGHTIEATPEGQPVSYDPRLRMALVIPTSCAHHLSDETEAGKVSYAGHL